MGIERELKDKLLKLFEETDRQAWNDGYEKGRKDASIARQSVTSEEVAEAIEAMKDNIELIKNIEKKINDIHPLLEKKINCYALAITALQEYQPWVSVEDRLPELGKDVLTIKPSGNCKVLRFETDCLWYDSYSEWDKGVTHWKPLPEPPKGE